MTFNLVQKELVRTDTEFNMTNVMGQKVNKLSAKAWQLVFI